MIRSSPTWPSHSPPSYWLIGFFIRQLCLFITLCWPLIYNLKCLIQNYCRNDGISLCCGGSGSGSPPNEQPKSEQSLVCWVPTQTAGSLLMGRQPTAMFQSTTIVTNTEVMCLWSKTTILKILRLSSLFPGYILIIKSVYLKVKIIRTHVPI